MENLLIGGYISATSKKISDDFKAEGEQKKTAYIVFDKKDEKKIKDFGLTIYTSKKDPEAPPFIIVKTSEKIVLYAPDVPEPMGNISGSAEDDSKNFKTDEKKPVRFNIIKGNHKGNDFTRLQAILLESMEQIEEIESANPFLEE